MKGEAVVEMERVKLENVCRSDSTRFFRVYVEVQQAARKNVT